MFECVVCDKTYKSERALRNHEASKKHKEQLKTFKRVMKDEDAMHGGEDQVRDRDEEHEILGSKMDGAEMDALHV